MTTTSTGRLAYQWNTIIDYGQLEYNPDAPEPMPDAMLQDPVIQDFLPILAERFTDANHSPDNFLSTNTILCHNPGNLNARVQPDCYIAFGVDVQAIRQRKMYLPWEAGKPPDFALEVGSESTKGQDTGEKRRIYAQMGVPEYWLFDPTGGDLYGQALTGLLLAGGAYRPVALTSEPDGVLKGYSPLLDLYLCWDGGELRFYDPAIRDYLRNFRQEKIAHAQTQADHAQTQAAHAQTQAAHAQTQADLMAERARVRELEDQLRRLRSGE